MALYNEIQFRKICCAEILYLATTSSTDILPDIHNSTNITKEIAEYAFQLFKENYNWSKAIRSLGVRGADLVTDNYWEQIDLFSNMEKREKQMKMDEAVDEIRKRFGFYSVQRGLMYQDRKLSAVNAKAEHTIHPRGYFA